MSSLESYLTGEIPFAEASAFYLRTKKAESYEPPDESGVLEGQFAVPLEQVLAFMGTMVENEFKTLLAYKIYAESLRGMAREGLAEEFQEHSYQELNHAEFLLKRMAVLGGPVHIPDIPAPPAASEPDAIVATMIRMEQEGIAKWRALHEMLGDNPMKYKVEEIMATEQRHLDELWQFAPQQYRINGAGAAGTPSVGPEQMQQAQVDGAGEPSEPTPAEKKEPAPAKDEKTAAAKKHAYLERMLPGTEGYYSDRMLAALQAMPAKVYTPEGVDYTTIEGEKLASVRLKHAFDEMMAAPTETTPPQAAGVSGAQMPGLDPRTSAFLANEASGRAVEEEQSSAYYKQQLDTVNAQLQAVQGQQQQVQQQAESLQQQAVMSQNAIAAAQQQAQQATTMAMQQVVQSGDESLRKTQEAAQMRMAFQQLRGSLMNLAAAEPPPSALQEQVPGMMGPAAPGAPTDPAAAAQGTDPAAAQGPAAQAPQAESQPGAVPPGGESSEEGPKSPSASEPSEPTGKKEPSTQVTVKHGGVMERLPGALAGAAIGGVGTAMEAGRGHDALRGRVQELEAQQGGFAKAMQLAAAKARLALGEVAEKHPVGASIMGSIAGAGIGAATQPAVQSLAQSAKRAFE